MKFLLLLTLFALPSFAQIETRYDKFKDTTTVYVQDTLSTRLGRITLTTGFVHPKSDDFILDFRAWSFHGWKFIKQHDLIFLADGERIEIGRGQWDGDAVKEYERILFAIDRPTLTKIANAQKVELQLGTVESQLSEKQRNEIKELLAYVVK